MNLMSEWEGPKSLMRGSSAHFLRALDGAGFFSGLETLRFCSMVSFYGMKPPLSHKITK